MVNSAAPFDDATTVVRFGDDFELRPAERTLRRNGQPLKLGGRAFDLLVALVERRDRVVSKNELMEIVWPRLVVEENNLQVHVLTLRKLLGPLAIATVPGRGYRFVAATRDVPPCTAAAAPARPAAPEREVGQGLAGSQPASAPALIGRDAEVRDLDAALQAHRLVTLIGAGGVGKSSLARQVAAGAAARYPEGTCWVDLGTVEVDTGVVDAIAAAAQVSIGNDAGGARDPLDALATALGPWRGLLVLDNAEHLLDAVARVAKSLVAGAPGPTLLITSQAPLRLVAEQRFRVEPLAVADPDAALSEALASPAVQLFVQRARASDRHFVLDAHNREAVVSLTRRLDGLPLAIEMAAARVPALSPAQLDAALDERFRLLTSGERLAPRRQHSLQAALQWTHGLLAEAEQAVFRRLSVFVGSFALKAAQEVCRDDAGAPGGLDEWQVVDALAVLVDRSLVAALPGGEPPRYRLLDTPQAFARERLQQAGEAERTAERHARAFGSAYARAYEEHMAAAQSSSAWLGEYGPDMDNGRAALDWALARHDATLALAMAPGLAQALGRSIPPRLRVWTSTEPHFREDLPAPVRARWLLGWAQYHYRYRAHDAEVRARQAIALFGAEGHAIGIYRAWAVIGTELGEDRAASADEALAQLRRLEDPAWPPGLRALRRRAEFTQLAARGRTDEALAIGESLLGADFAGAARAQGPGAAHGAGAADGTTGTEGAEPAEGGGFAHVGAMMYLEMVAGRPERAVARGMAARARSGHRLRDWSHAGMDMLIVLAWVLRGDAAGARELAPDMWRSAAQLNFRAPVAPILSLLAALEQRHHAAALLLGYAGAEQERTGFSAQPLGQGAGERAAALASAALGEAKVARLLARGRRLGEGDVPRIAFARSDEGDA